MNIEALSISTGETRRNIRYLISLGIVPPPSGYRSSPIYTQEHVASIQRYKNLKSIGLKISAIQNFGHQNQNDESVSLVINDDLVLSVNSRVLSKIDLNALKKSIVEAYENAKPNEEVDMDKH